MLNRERASQRFVEHRRAFDANPALHTLYARWYGKVRASLPPARLGPWLELGSGPGLARGFIPELLLSDVVRAPWLDVTTPAEVLPARNASLGALVLFDVLHHLPNPAAFMREATRVLAPGGRIILCEPLVSPLSYPIYRFLHPEGLDGSVDPFTMDLDRDKDPFAGNQAVATIMLQRRREEVETHFPGLRVSSLERFAGLSYPASGGFGKRPALPASIWRWLDDAEQLLPEGVFRFIGFRLLAVIERR